MYFKVYTTLSDSQDDVNPIIFSDTGSGTNQVVPWTKETKLYIEELDFDLYVDCATKYDGASTASISNLERFNAQNVLAQGDGYGYENTVNNATFNFKIHGESQSITTAQVGFGIQWEVIPLPLAIPVGGTSKQTNLVFPKHVRSVSMVFNNTIGGKVNNKPIALKTFGNTDLGSAPEPQSGVFEYGLMKGWNDYKYTSIEITHEQPFDIRLIGIFYKVEV